MSANSNYDLSEENARYEETDAVREAKQYVLEYLNAINVRATMGSVEAKNLLEMHRKHLVAQTNQDKAQTATAFLLAHDLYHQRVIGSQQ